ncbi:alpha/beta fold hydrolase [Bacillus sp. Marseille-P3661]|uniref:alpha/beta fold hydrolase n=1 Tax=Bacillus sp. Marseille-P3661 TaxID=1936234 RepID=UPI0015E1A56B|nr:alpha/beta hydrolase [Bacillus sp. Marseille-P3661]
MYSKYIKVDGIRTHYIEAGEGDNYVILLHGAEFGGNSQNSWEYNIQALSKHFHVFAIDMLGFGGTEKIFHFEDIKAFRIEHIRKFMDTLCIDSASFIGNSMGGGLILKVASEEKPRWNINKAITISGGGPNNPETHSFVNNYDCTFDYMRKIHHLFFYDDAWKQEEYVNKRYLESIKPGAWEALSVSRFKSPLAKQKASGRIPDYSSAYKNIKVPILICAGDQDKLKLPDYSERLSNLIPNSQVKVFKDCSHCAQIEKAEEFNDLAIDFLK